MSFVVNSSTAVVSLAVGLGTALGLVVVIAARYRVSFLKETGETFADRNVSLSRGVLMTVPIAIAAISLVLALRTPTLLSFFGCIACVSGLVYLSLLDIDTHLLPWVDTWIIAMASCSFLMVDAITTGRAAVVATMILGATFSWVVFRVLEVVSRGDLGGGDVVLAGFIGAALGWFGMQAIIRGFVYAFVVSGVVALFLMVCTEARRHTAIAFGPFLAIGAVAVIISSDAYYGEPRTTHHVVHQHFAGDNHE